MPLNIHNDRIPQSERRGLYASPSVNEVAVLLLDEVNDVIGMVLQQYYGQLKRMFELHRAYDPLQYPSIFISCKGCHYLTIPLKISQIKAYHVYSSMHTD